MSDIQVARRRRWSPVASVVLVWSATLIASVLSAIMSSAALPGVVPVVFIRPITLLVILLFIALMGSLILRTRLGQSWQEAMICLPFALGGAAFLSWLGIWNDGSGATAMRLLDAVMFLGTAGIFPFSMGPEILLRGTLFVLVVVLAIRAMRRGVPRGRVIIFALASWTLGGIVLLIPTWMAAIAAQANGLTIFNTQDALRAIGTIQVNSYWSSFQSDRFFAGVGRQLETSLALSSASIAFLIGVVLLVVIMLRNQSWARPGVIMKLVRHLATVGWHLAFVASGLVAGVLIGARAAHLAWGSLDIVAFLVLLVAVLAWFAFWSFGRDIEDLSKDERDHPERPLPSGLVSVDDLQELREVLLCLSFIAGMLLGWPVLLLLLAIATLGWMASAEGFGWCQTGGGRIVRTALTTGVFVVMGGLFVARTAVFPSAVISLAITWSVVTAAAKLSPKAAFLQPNVRRHAVLGLLIFGWIATFIVRMSGT